MGKFNSRFNILGLSIIFVVMVSLFPSPGLAQYYGEKYEPPSGRVYQGLGQQTDPDNLYALKNFDADNQPLILSDYLNISGVVAAANPDLLVDNQIRYWLLNFPGTGLLLGTNFLDTTGNNIAAGIAAGTYDSAIRTMARHYGQYQVPIFIRPGYEFQTDHNGRGAIATNYVNAFRHVVDIFRNEYSLRGYTDNIAWIWNSNNTYVAADSDHYPGDSYVDWCGMNTWTGNDFVGTPFQTYQAFCNSHSKPMFSGPETTNRYASGTTTTGDWNNFFVPFFSGVETKNVKGFMWINWDWPATSFASKFQYDNRLQITPSIWKNYQARVKQAMYINRKEGIYTSAAPANHSPVALISPIPIALRYSATAPYTITLLNNSYDYDGDAFTCLWDFGDGATSTNCNPGPHTYTVVGDYYPKLTVDDQKGGRGVALAWVGVGSGGSVTFNKLGVSFPDAASAHLSFTIDGQSYTTNPSPSFAKGSLHTIDVPSPQVVGTQTWVFAGWSIGGPKSQTIVADAYHIKGPQAYFELVSGADTSPPVGILNASPQPAALSVPLSVQLGASAAADLTPPISYQFELYLGSKCPGTGAIQTSTYGTSTTFLPATLQPNTTYAWRYRAKDSAPTPNTSAFSECTKFTTAAPTDAIAPAAPKNLKIN